MTGRDPRFAELDRLIAAERLGRPKGTTGIPWSRTKRERLEATAAEMRAKYARRRGRPLSTRRIASNSLPVEALQIAPDPPRPDLNAWIVEDKLVRETEQPWIKRRRKYLRETGRL